MVTIFTGFPTRLNPSSSQIHDDDREGVWAAVNRAIQARKPFLHQYRIRNAIGNYTWVRSRAAVSYCPSGEATRMVGSTSDITAQMLAQDREKFVKISADLFGKIDPETGRFTMLSPNWPDVVGYSINEMKRRTFFDNALPEDHEAIEKTLRKLRNGKAVRGFVTRFAHKEEGVIYLEWNANSPTPGSSEIYMTARDVTDSDQAKFQVMAKVVPDVFYIVDLPGQRVIYQNRDRGASIGYSQDQIDAMDDMMSELVHPDDRPRLKQHYQEMAEAVDGEVVDFEYRLRHVDGFYCSFFGRDSVYRRNVKGEVQQIVGTATDVTRLREYTKELEHSSLMLNNANRELSHSNADLEQFAYAASHDLQEPLRAIRGFVQLLQAKYLDQLDEQAQGYIGKALSGVDRMGSVIDGLLNYAKIGQSDGGFGAVDLTMVINDAVDVLDRQIKSTNAKLDIAELPKVYGNQLLLTQLFQNLLSNALKYRNENTRPEISIRVEELEQSVRVFVRDNGIGIEPHYLKQIFGLFKRLHRRSEYPGTGLGLAIVKRIVERHQGKILVESTLGEGSVFVVELWSAKAKA